MENVNVLSVELEGKRTHVFPRKNLKQNFPSLPSIPPQICFWKREMLESFSSTMHYLTYPIINLHVADVIVYHLDKQLLHFLVLSSTTCH